MRERLRTDACRRYKRVEGAKAIAWKMLQVAEMSWRKLNAPELLSLVASGMRFKDGIRPKSGNETNDMNHQPERTAAGNPVRHLLTVAREPAPNCVSHESLLVEESSTDMLVYLYTTRSINSLKFLFGVG
jgi:hypothetical protein